MDRTAALTRLTRMVAASTRPVLDADDLDALIDDYAAIADSQRRAPSHAEWVPTWDLNHAAAEGWDWKANRVSDLYSVSADGQTLDREKIYQHCVERSEHYRKKKRGSIQVKGYGGQRYPIDVQET